MAMVLAVTAFAGLFKDLGLSAATVQWAELNHSQLSTMFWINLGVGTILMLILAAAAPCLVWFYRRPDVFWVTVALSANMFLSSAGIQHGALLKRRLRFTALAIASTSSAVLGALVSILAAIAGLRCWALVLGSLSAAAGYSGALWMLSGWTPGLPARASGVQGMLRYGARLTGFDLVNYFARNLDSLLIGQAWGTEALGLYSRAYAILLFPISNLRGPLNAVAFPALSRLQGNRGLYRTYYRTVVSVLAFASMPLAALLFVTSADVICLLLGERWVGASPICRMLAVTAFIQPAASLRGLVLMSLGQAERYLHWGLWHALATVVSFGIGIWWGPLGIATAYGLVNYAILYPSLRYVFKGTPVKPADFFQATAKPAIASLVAGLVALLWHRVSVPDQPALTLFRCALPFALAYIAVFSLLPGGMAQLKQYASCCLVVLPPAAWRAAS